MHIGKINVSEIRVGDSVPPVKYKITNEQIKDYAKLSTDNNPLHVDEEFAKNTPFKGIIAHGTIPLAYLFQAVYDYFSMTWLNGLKFDVKFIAPVRPGDVVSCGGRIKEVDLDKGKVSIDLQCLNQADATVIAGVAVVPIQ